MQDVSFTGNSSQKKEMVRGLFGELDESKTGKVKYPTRKERKT
jgi:hypothetical protein